MPKLVEARFHYQLGPLGLEGATLAAFGGLFYMRSCVSMDPDPAAHSTPDADLPRHRMQASAEYLSSVFARTAAALERSAELADEHADRRQRAGVLSEAEAERRAAAVARGAAERARARSDGSRERAHKLDP
jgi:hypothetical protein